MDLLLIQIKALNGVLREAQILSESLEHSLTEYIDRERLKKQQEEEAVLAMLSGLSGKEENAG